MFSKHPLDQGTERVYPIAEHNLRQGTDGIRWDNLKYAGNWGSRIPRIREKSTLLPQPRRKV